MTNGYAAVNGLRIYYEIHSAAGGAAGGPHPPLVLLHGGGSTIETSFASLVPVMAKTRQVIAFEQQGHGRTADADRPFTFDGSADDAAALLRDLNIERADLLGYSNGGSIALQLAIRHPEQVRRLVAVSATFRRQGMYDEFWESMQHASLESMPAELQDAYVRTSPHPERLQSFHDKSVQRMLDFTDFPAEAMQSIQAPVLIMAGDADVVRPEHAVEMFRLLPHARLAILPGTDHMAIVRWTEGQVAMVTDFLDSP